MPLSSEERMSSQCDFTIHKNRFSDPGWWWWWCLVVVVYVVVVKDAPTEEEEKEEDKEDKGRDEREPSQKVQRPRRRMWILLRTTSVVFIYLF